MTQDCLYLVHVPREPMRLCFAAAVALGAHQVQVGVTSSRKAEPLKVMVRKRPHPEGAGWRARPEETLEGCQRQGHGGCTLTRQEGRGVLPLSVHTRGCYFGKELIP